MPAERRRTSGWLLSGLSSRPPAMGERPQMAETRHFAAVHNFAMLEGKSNGRTRPFLVSRDVVVQGPLRQQKQSFGSS